MRPKHSIWFGILFFYFSSMTLLLAQNQEISQTASIPENTRLNSTSQDNLFANWFLPEVTKNWEVGINIDEDEKPRIFADLILPILPPHITDRVLFFEPRANHNNSEALYNFGLGYRQLVHDSQWLMGSNVFYDYDTHVSHQRLGIGFEALSSYAELRANGYFGLSLNRITQFGTNSEIVEKAVDGYDLEFGVPIPYYSRLKLFGGYEWYDFKKFKNRDGWSVRTEYKPLPFIVIDVTLSDNNKRDTGWGATIAFRPTFWNPTNEPIRSPFQLDSSPFPKQTDMSDHLFIPVERHHEIVVESYTESSGQVTVEIKRGT